MVKWWRRGLQNRSIVSNRSARAWFLVRYTLRAVRSVFSEEKKLSIAALSQPLPDRLMLQRTP